MSFNGSGTFVVNSAGQPVVTGTTITSTAFNLLTADLATGLSTTLTKDGQSTPTANIPMGSFKLTGLANGTLAADAVRMSQLQSNGANYITVAGTADVITGGVTPALTAYAAGNEFVFVVGSTNTTNVTLNVDGLGAKAITKDGTGALTAGDLTAGDVALVVYDGTRFQLVSASYGVSSWAGGTTGLTPASATTGAVSLAGTLVVANGGTGAATLAANNVLLGNGTSAVQVVAPGTSGNVLTSNGTTWASTALSSGAVTTFTAGTTGLTPSSPTAGAISLAGTLAVANGGTGGTTSTGTGAVVLATNPALVGYTVNTASGVDGEWTTTGLTVYANAVTPQHDGPLHVMSGTAGTVTASGNADELIVEGAGSVGLSFLFPDAQGGSIYFTTPTRTGGHSARIYADYNAGADRLQMYVANSGNPQFEMNATGVAIVASGVTAQHDAVLHVMSGTAGTWTADSGSMIVAESAVAGGISIGTPDAITGTLSFSSPTKTAASGALVQFNYNSGVFGFRTFKVGAEMQFKTGNDTTALTLDSSQNATFTGQIRGASGTAAAPEYSFVSSTGTGHYLTDVGGGVYNLNSSIIGVQASKYSSAGAAITFTRYTVTADNATGSPMDWQSSTGGQGGIHASTTNSITTAKEIMDVNNDRSSALIMVTGSANSSTYFSDIIHFQNGVTVVNARTNSASARTYSLVSQGHVYVAMASGTYVVIANALRTPTWH